MPGLRNLSILAMMAAILAVPFALRPKDNLLASADETLVIISPHNEAIRQEFALAFGHHYKATYGKTIRIDWRTPGGTSEISKYIASEYLAAFQYYWEKTLGKRWDSATQAGFDNYKVSPAATPAEDTPEQSARRAFLESEVTSGLDLFFGGGSYDFIQQATAGRLVPTRVFESHPEWIAGENAIPLELGGEPYRDPASQWVGTCLSAFGICYNSDVLERLGIPAPTRWSDLAGPEYRAQVALADPTKSGSAAKAFEMLIQQQMHEALARLETSAPDMDPKTREQQAISEGWDRGLELIQAISANARYFTDSASKIPLDVSLGDAAAGMCIDFYGRFQSEAVALPEGKSRMTYFTPAGGSSIGVDPIGILRGAPHREAAERFIAFVLSLEGQKLWNFKPGTPGGPEKFALRRLPIRKELYAEEFRQYRSDPDVEPYREAARFQYHAAWTAPLFRQIAFVVRVMCLDPHDELRQAARSAQTLGATPSPEAARLLANLDGVRYTDASTTIREALRSKDKIEEVRLAKQLGQKFRTQYQQAVDLAHQPTN